MNEQLIAFGSEVKALGIDEANQTATIGGFLVLFGNENERDFDGDFFTKETDYGPHNKSLVLYQHGQDSHFKGHVFDHDASLEVKDAGVWIEAQLSLRDEYERAVYDLAKKRKLGWSSGTAPHVVEREPAGKGYHITKWYLGLDASLTPTPADYRNVVEAKSIQIKSFEQLLQEELSDGDNEPEASVKADDAKAEAVQVGDDGFSFNEDNEVKSMSEQTQVAPVDTPAEGLTLDAIKAAFAEELKPMQAEIEALKASQVDDELPVVAPAVKTDIGVGNIKKVSSLGFSDDYLKSFNHWLRTGDEVAIKAALQEGTDSEGGYLVPDDYFRGIIAKRDELSLVRMIPNVMRFRTNRDVINVPVENSSTAQFGLTAEEAAYDQVEPTFSQVAINIYKFTRKLVMSEELETDEDSGLQSFISNWVGRAVARTENQYFINGTGTSQPQGILAGGTAALTLDNAASVTAAEVPEIVGTLSDEYQDGAVWIMQQSVENAIRSLQGNQFLFAPTPYGTPGQRQLWDYPVYNSDRMPAGTTGLKSIAFGNMEFYGWADHTSGFSVQRDPYTAADNGQIVLRWRFRFGGAVLLAEAINYATQA